MSAPTPPSGAAAAAEAKRCARQNRAASSDAGKVGRSPKFRDLSADNAGALASGRQQQRRAATSSGGDAQFPPTYAATRSTSLAAAPSTSGGGGGGGEDRRSRSDAGGRRAVESSQSSIGTVSERSALLSGRSARRRRRNHSSLAAQPVQMQRELSGFALVTCAALSYSVMTLLVRMGATFKSVRFPSFQLVFSRSMFQWIVSLATLLSLGHNPLGRKEMRFWLVMRGTLGAVGVVCLFYSLTHLSLGECTVLAFTMPIMTILFAHLFLGEPLELLDELLAVTCLFGVGLVLRPQMFFKHHQLVTEPTKLMLHRAVGTATALSAALAQASIYIMIRKMGASVHHMMNVFYLGVVCTLISPVGVFIEGPWRMPADLADWTVILGVGFFGLLAQVFMSRGLQLCRAGPGSMLTNLQVLFSAFLGFLLLHEIPSGSSILGTFIILASTLGVTARKWYSVR